MRDFFRLAVRLWRLRRLRELIESPLWPAAQAAVAQVAGDGRLQQAAERELRTPFCSRCGQIPDGDRRMDEAREILLTSVSARRHEADLALAFHYFLKKS